jgi:hypothetical protein
MRVDPRPTRIGRDAMPIKPRRMRNRPGSLDANPGPMSIASGAIGSDLGRIAACRCLMRTDPSEVAIGSGAIGTGRG